MGPEASPKTAVVTGAASGIGLALTLSLLDRGWSVAALVRRTLPDLPALQSALAEHCLRLYTADLAASTSRRSAAAAIAAHELRIDLLFNNAGVATGTPQLSPQGRELHFEVNTLAPFVLANQLLVNLAAARGRIVNTVSDAIFFPRRYDPAQLAHPVRFRRIIGPYASSKLALALWSSALAPALAASGVSVVSVTPGPTDTPLNRSPGMPLWMRPLVRLAAKPPAYAAETLLDAATGPYLSGGLSMKRKPRPLPFLDQAERTLRIVTEAAQS